jgi:hypothetical protein
VPARRRQTVDLTDAEMRAQRQDKSTKVLPGYAKRTMKQVTEGTRKQRAQSLFQLFAGPKTVFWTASSN